MAINQITIEGNVGTDPEMKFTNDESLATFSLAHTPWSKTKGQGDTIWFRVTFWERKADAIMDNVKKGDKILVIGTFKSATYTDREGNTKVSMDITGSEFAIMPRNAKNTTPVASTTEVAPW
jgi:single-strand DNA-binding protein